MLLISCMIMKMAVWMIVMMPAIALLLLLLQRVVSFFTVVRCRLLVASALLPPTAGADRGI